MERFGEYIRRLRIANKLNQTELAAKIGIDSGGLSKVENGKKQLKNSKLESLALALNINVEEIKKQYLSEKFANECFKYKCSETVFHLAEEKAKYFNNLKIKQGKLEL